MELTPHNIPNVANFGVRHIVATNLLGPASRSRHVARKAVCRSILCCSTGGTLRRASRPTHGSSGVETNLNRAVYQVSRKKKKLVVHIMYMRTAFPLPDFILQYAVYLPHTLSCMASLVGLLPDHRTHHGWGPQHVLARLVDSRRETRLDMRADGDRENRQHRAVPHGPGVRWRKVNCRSSSLCVFVGRTRILSRE